MSGPFFAKLWYIQIVTALLYIKLIRFSFYFCSVAGDSSKTAAEVLTAHVREISLPDHPDDPHQLITVRRRHIWSDTKRAFSKPYANLITCTYKVGDKRKNMQYLHVAIHNQGFIQDFEFGGEQEHVNVHVC